MTAVKGSEWNPRRRSFLQAAAAATAAAAGMSIAGGRRADAAGLSPVSAFDVRDFGAAGNGVKDDTGAIQDAIDAAGEEGGMVFFGPGVYAIRTVAIPSAVHLRGSGIDASVLRRASQGGGALIESPGFSDLTGSDSAGGPTAFSIRDLTLDGGRDVGGSGEGVKLYAYGYELTEIVVHNCEGDGIYSEWGATGSIGDGSHEMEARFSGVRCHTNGGNGLHFRGPHDSMFVNCLAYHNDRAGFRLTGVSHGSQLVNLHSWGAEQSVGFELDALAISCSNCYGDIEGGVGVAITRNECQWLGGRIIGSRSDSDEVGLRIGGGDAAPVSGTMVDTYIQNCSTAAVDLPATADGKPDGDGGGNVIKARLFQAPNEANDDRRYAFLTGVPHPSTQLEITQGIEDASRNRVAVPGFELRAETSSGPSPDLGSVRVFSRIEGGRTQLCAMLPSGEVTVLAEDSSERLS